LTEKIGAVSSHRFDWRLAALWAAITLGGIVRFYALGRIPAGLNSDEASSGVEAISILRTGMDIWGNHMPVWFPAWGSGMNPLYTYLAVPVFSLLGANVVTLRLIGAVFGLLTLPVTYYATRLYFGRDTALLTLGLVAFLPWHVMSSRWALDSNLLPFFFTLGLLTIGKALRDGGCWPILALLPWAISPYAYGVSVIPATIAGLAILILYRRQIVSNLGLWITGAGIALIIDLPFLMFLARNNLHLAHLPWEDIMPFSLPVMPSTRLDQIRQGIVTTVYDNLAFFISGYRDGMLWHQGPVFPPLTGAAPLLTIMAVISLALVSRHAPRNITSLPNVILIVLLSAIVPACLIPLQLTRLNWFYIPSLMAIASMLLCWGKQNRLVLQGGVLYLGAFLTLFYPYYFTRYNSELPTLDANLGNGFRVGVEDALRAEVAAAGPDEPILVDIGTVHPYLYVLFYGLGDIKSFQASRNVRVEDGVYRVSSFDRFFFEKDAIPPNRSFVFVSLVRAMPCTSPIILNPGPLWAVGRCAAQS
jgi:hypothetical protein